MYFKPYKDVSGKWRWQFVGDNHRIVAVPGENFANRTKAIENINLVRQHAAISPIVDERDKELTDVPLLNSPVGSMAESVQREFADDRFGGPNSGQDMRVLIGLPYVLCNGMRKEYGSLDEAHAVYDAISSGSKDPTDFGFPGNVK